MKRVILSAIGAWLVLAPAAPAAKHTVEFTVSAGKHDRANEPVCVPLQLPQKVEKIENKVEVLDAKGKRLATGVLTPPGVAAPAVKAEAKGRRFELHFLLPKLEAGKSVTLKAVIEHGLTGANAPFVPAGALKEEGDDGALRFSPLGVGRKVLRYVQPKLDDSTPAKREATFKPFHHVYSPDGKVLVTKGVGGQFTHHRGLFYGFMKTTYDGATVDIWHCKGDTHQAAREAMVVGQGDFLVRQLCSIDWNGKGKMTFAKELRELTVYNVPGGTLIEFVSKLTPTGGDVKLDGDPQHAGFHFRASNEVAEKTKNQTIFIRPDGVGKAGTEVNWPKNKKHVNLPWLAMSFVVGGKRYTAAYLDHPKNPKEARYSERTYGRFGSYFVTTVTKDRPLVVRYRVWLQDGQMTQEQVKAKSAAFVTPAEVKVK